MSPLHPNARFVFRFGLISDIQYADINDAMNFSGTESRCYRDTLQHTRAAVQSWNQLEPRPLFISQLGDLIDGQNSGTYGQGLQFEQPQSMTALRAILRVLHGSRVPIHHSVGNHELYNFSWAELRDLLNQPVGQGPEQTISRENFYYSFSPYSGWRCVMLNPYEISVMQPESHPGYQAAEMLLRSNNPNYERSKQGSVNFFDGLQGDQQRFVPFNGGLGERQLTWLHNVLELARDNGERVLVFSHIPLCSEASSEKNLAYDYAEVLRILHQIGAGSVVAVLAGHYHQGGYARDNKGIHHITLSAPLTHGESFGHLDVYEQQLVLTGTGGQSSYTLPI